MYTNGKYQNIGNLERCVSAFLGSSLLVYSAVGPRKYKILTAIGGAGLLYRGIRGNSVLYNFLGINQQKGELPPLAVVAHKEGKKITRAVTINKSREQLYEFWRDFRNLPKFMKNLESVELIDDKKSRWKWNAAGKLVEWDAEIYNEIPNELIAWRVLPGSDIKHAGSVLFKAAPNGSGTEVKFVLNYDPPAGKLGATIAKLFRQEPGQQIQEDLRRLKQMMEVGEIPTTEGQPTGRKKSRIRKETVFVG